jgi:hypothetical protein
LKYWTEDFNGYIIYYNNGTDARKLLAIQKEIKTNQERLEAKTGLSSRGNKGQNGSWSQKNESPDGCQTRNDGI